VSPSNLVLERENVRLRKENERLLRENTQAYLALRVIRPGPIGRWLLKREMRRMAQRVAR
jgi:hypothetical protein